jgi:hypothetical protein
VTEDDLALLARLSGVRIAEQDLAAVAENLAAHCEFVAPLLRADLGATPAAVTLDPRWHD